jgi:hypothetical protein
VTKQLPENRLEDDRKILIEKCQSAIQTHAGFIIATTIGSLTLISRWESFLNDSNFFTRFSFYLALSLVFGVSVYFAGRLIYWNALNNVVTFVTNRHVKCYDCMREKGLLYGKKSAVSPICKLQEMAMVYIENDPQMKIPRLFSKNNITLVVIFTAISFLVFAIADMLFYVFLIPN